MYVYHSVVLSDNILHYFVKKNKNILTNAKEKNPSPVLILFQIVFELLFQLSLRAKSYIFQDVPLVFTECCRRHNEEASTIRV